MKETFSLHKVTSNTKFPFDPQAYSKFKFGCKETSREFGIALAESFAWKYIISRSLQMPLVVVSSPYCFIPTATFALKDYFIQRLNQYLVQAGMPVVEETKIHRTITYKEDYGELSAEDRLKLIQNDGFHIDKSFLAGKTLLFLDDIKITGSHEKVIERMITQMGIENDRIFVYFAELTNSAIDPRVENQLNYAFVQNLLDLDKIIKNESFILNTRIVKYILNYNDEAEFKAFINFQRVKLVETIYHLALGNSYHLIPDYSRNLSYIKQLLNK